MDIFKENLISFIIPFIKEKNKQDIDPQEAEKLIKTPPDSSYGDYSVASYYLTKYGFKGKAEDAASELLNYAQANFEQIKDFFSKIEIKGPYVNFFVHKEKFIGVIVKNVLKHNGSYGRGLPRKPEKVIIDFSSPNIAKPFGVGHLRSTVIGMSLANIYEFCGHNVLKINYLGDFGTQFGKLITAFCRYGDIDFHEFEKDPVKALYGLYVRIHKEAQTDLSLEEDARLRFKRLEENILKSKRVFEEYLENLQHSANIQKKEDECTDIKITAENKSGFCGTDAGQYDIWRLFRSLSIEEFKRIYNLIGISFDVYEGESQSAEFANEVVKILYKSGLAAESEGAIIVPLKDIKTPALIAKSDGTSLYLSRDIVTAVLRMAKYNYDKMIYVVGSEQSLHFNQLFNIFDLLRDSKDKLSNNPFFQKYASSVSGRLVHVKFGRIIGMSTRKGNLVFLEDYIDEASKRAAEKLKERDAVSNSAGTVTGFSGNDENKKDIFTLDEKESTALKIGIGAVIFNDLKTRRNTDVNFNWDNVLSFEGQTGPYLQYTVSRINSLIARLIKGNDNGVSPVENRVNDAEFNAAAGIKETGTSFDNTAAVSERDNDFNEIYLIVKQISVFKDNIEAALNLNEPSIISSYILELASLFNKYYQNYRLIGRDYEYIKPRLYLLTAIKIILINALKLLCIPILERM